MAIDKATGVLLGTSEQQIVEAEAAAQKGVVTEAELASAIRHCYLVGNDVRLMEARRKQKNLKAQQVVKGNTAIFKPMMDRGEKVRSALREAIFNYMAPGGSIGNMLPDEVKSYGEDGLGVAGVAEVPSYTFDIALLAKHHPELLSVDEAAVTKLFKSGKNVKGATPVRKLQLRIT